ncbi:hypothetical protein BWI17_02145 [Betaproteobacteria bacterium GR16-43]|nr:hypothetical protein BWI17_02145 [Betaproteobacteria bacterium GR16-43]
MSFPLIVRAAIVALIAILILGAIALINGKISERSHRAATVERQFEEESSGAQLVSGPFLVLTCERALKSTVAECEHRTQAFVPKLLNIDVSMPVETLHRGIYPILQYRSTIALTGTIEWPAPPAQDSYGVAAWKHAYLVVAVTDPRGIKSVSPEGTASFDPRFAIRLDFGPWSAHKAGEIVAFDVKTQINGTSNLMFTPIGDQTAIKVVSPWPHPSFTGAWAPDSRTIGDSGFEATWRIRSQATGGLDRWRKSIDDGSLFKTGASTGLALFNPVNVYALSYRATEYAFLFLLFTFAALALAEVLGGVKLHAIQYLLVGSALAVFFLLLIALSEHIAFGRAYAFAAGACVALLTTYLRHPLRTYPKVAAFFGMFVTLYGALYALLRLEDHAMLVGSLMVFGVLAVTMIATRQVDWAEFSRRIARPSPAAG